MKKFQYLIALAAAFVGFTSCEDDKEPVYHQPTEFHLNTPPLADQLYQLDPTMTVELTCSQPNYGYSAITNYGIDVSLTNEFTENEDGTPNYYSISTGTSARMSVKGSDLATAICTLNGIDDFDSYPAETGLPIAPVYIRATAKLSGVDNSYIRSAETICLQKVEPYNPYPEGGKCIYMLGGPAGWNIDASPCKLMETFKGSNVYTGAFEFGAGEQYFRFYLSLGNWGNDGELPSIGPKANDADNLEVAITDQPVQHKAVPGKGSWYTPSSWGGGYITLTVDLTGLDEENPQLSEIFVTMQAGNYDITKMNAIYLVGACSAWSVDDQNAEAIYAKYKLYDYDDNGIFTGTFNVPQDKATFRFYTELGDWNKGSLGYQVDDTTEGVNLSFTNGEFSGPYVEGKGSWNFPNWTGGNVRMTVNTNDHSVKFEAVPATE